MCLSCCACCCNPSASVSLLNEANQQLNLRDLGFSKEESTVDERTYRSIVLVVGYVRRFDIPKDIVSLFHQYYFERFEAIWSPIYKGDAMELSENNLKCTLSERNQACRGRDPISKGMMVEWTLQFDISTGITIGVIKSGQNDFNSTADYELHDCYGIDNCTDRVYYGDHIRHRMIMDYMEIKPFHKPRLISHDTDERVRVVCDYRGERALLTYYINGKICKPESQDHTFELPKIQDKECWHMLVDFESVPAWCRIVTE
eukprot:274487_1